jgi:Protein of unknown function (DUF1501)
MSKQTRRRFLTTGLTTLGAAVIPNVPQPRLAQDRGFPNHAPRVKRVIHLCMAGGMSHLESFDPKPQLAAMRGKPMPASFTSGQPIAQLQGKKLLCLAPQFEFSRHGESGQELSSVFPYMGRIADDICIIRSLQTEQINHDPAHTFMNTGTSISGRPSMGSWLLHALGSDCDDLPGYVVLTSVGRGGQSQPIASRQWHSGFLPSNLQGVYFQSRGAAVHYVERPPGVDRAGQRAVLDAIAELNRGLDARRHDPEIAARIQQYELAFKMQESVPKLADFSDESEHTFAMYGTRGGDGSYAANCLLARRLAERGVRFIQLYHRGWDQHGGIRRGFTTAAKEVDQATTALLLDLKQRGLLEDTLVIFGSEFGRTPMAQGNGRDHHIRGFSTWLAGGGVRGGTCHGATDELGYHAVENLVHVHDLHATMLHLLGIEHERLTYRYKGRDFRLTDVAGRVVHEILA